MELHVPGGGTLIAALLATEHATATDLSGGDAIVAGVTPRQLDDAIAALQGGEIEYLGLHDAGAFLQVAGEGAGPYQIEVNPGQGGDQVCVPGGVTDEAVRAALHGFLNADPTWAQPFPWQVLGPAGAPPPRRSGLRRLFGRD